MSEAKDKRIIDAYMKKHPDASIQKIESYAQKKGIHITVMPQTEHQRLKTKMMKDAGLDANLDLGKESDQIKLLEAVNSLPKEKQSEFLAMMKK